MEELQPTPLKINSTCFTIYRLLHEIEAEIVQFTNLPVDTSSLDLLAQHINKKLGFIRNMLNAEIASYGTRPHDLSEIEGKLTELEEEYHESNLHPVNAQDRSDDSEIDSGSGSVCESCLNDDRIDESSADEAPEMLYGVVVPPSEVVYESMVPVSVPEKVETVFECKGEVTSGGKKRRWWRTVAVLTTVSAALTVSFSGYLVSKQYEGSSTPT